MKIDKILFYIFVILPFSAIAQEGKDSLEINKISNYYYINDNPILCITYELINKGDDNYWFWFEKDDLSNKSEKKIIREHFFKVKEDWSLYQMALEYNVTGNYVTEIFSGFVKYIRPREHFVISIVATEKFSECKDDEIFNYLDEHIVVFSECFLSQYVKGLDNFNPNIFYKEDFIALPLNLLNIKQREN
jgi:hypothetical protein